ncbi:MAG: hypothetical protein U9P81_06515 [Euryarchaeota archaeon]|nr:hypothetical protein [Euryarchaeota archaeon]
MSISSLNNFEDILKNDLSYLFNFEMIDTKHFIQHGKEESTIELELKDNNKLELNITYSRKGYSLEVADYFLNFVNKTSMDKGIINIQYSSRNIPSQIFSIRREINMFHEMFSEIDKADFKRKSELENMLKIMYEKIDSEIQDYKNELIDSEKMFLTSKLNNNLISIHVTMDSYVGEIPIHDNKVSIDYKIPLIFSTPNKYNDIEEIYKKLVKTKKLNEVLDVLINRIPYFEDIRQVDDELLVLLKNQKESLPLSFMGDGFKALLKMNIIMIRDDDDSPYEELNRILFEELDSLLRDKSKFTNRKLPKLEESNNFFILKHPKSKGVLNVKLSTVPGSLEKQVVKKLLDIIAQITLRY